MSNKNWLINSGYVLLGLAFGVLITISLKQCSENKVISADNAKLKKELIDCNAKRDSICQKLSECEKNKKRQAYNGRQILVHTNPVRPVPQKKPAPTPVQKPVPIPVPQARDTIVVKETVVIKEIVRDTVFVEKVVQPPKPKTRAWCR
ncbi:MAG: hypothetical protein LBD50_01065 [Rickettsiales bacterium]|nr:hypothetical protein [Rickettsiales bacterium]